jgi:hypothetical protein
VGAFNYKNGRKEENKSKQPVKVNYKEEFYKFPSEKNMGPGIN